MWNLIPEDPHILASNILAPFPKSRGKARKWLARKLLQPVFQTLSLRKAFEQLFSI
jgi:hypothetical protein